MPQYLFVLGRKAEISTQEIKTVFKDKKIILQSTDFLLLKSEKKVDTKLKIKRFGGTIKIGKLIQKVNEKEIIATITDFLLRKYPTQNKIKFGINLLNFPVRNLNKYLIGVKKALKNSKKNGRFINKNLKNTALPAIVSEGLLKKKGSEIILVKSNNCYLIAETEAVQDIDKYSLRDYKKPFRDAHMGMLPPKLAQILINFAELQKGQILWDPFCGSGTVLMEGLLQNLHVIGSDLKKENIDGTNQNLWWICKTFDLPKNYQTFVHDVTEKLEKKPDVNAIVCESFLGKPKKFLPPKKILDKEIIFLENLYEKFFTNLKSALKKETTIVICLPCFRNRGDYIFLENILEKIKNLGYTLVALSKDKRGSLIYDRKDQIVGREIFKFQKN